MSIITVTTRITRQYLERKTKSDLAQMYLDLLDDNDRLEKAKPAPATPAATPMASELVERVRRTGGNSLADEVRAALEAALQPAAAQPQRESGE